MKNHELNDNASINGTSLRDYVTLPYAKLAELFGHPDKDRCDKVSTEWAFESETGEVFTLYDYKMTESYSPGLPSVESFRALPSYQWHIGAQRGADVAAFIQWIEFKVSGDSTISVKPNIKMIENKA